jgi:hypothetical protein
MGRKNAGRLAPAPAFAQKNAMAASILAPFKPTGQPFEPGPRGLFTLSWGQQGEWGGGVRPLEKGEAVAGGHRRVCLVHCQPYSFDPTFHARRSRFEGHWIGSLKGWAFPDWHAQKVADLVDRVSGFLGSRGVSLTPAPVEKKARLAPEAARKQEEEAARSARLLERSLQKPWAYDRGGLKARFVPSCAFLGGAPAVEFSFEYEPALIDAVRKIPGARWCAERKVWLTPGHSLRVARKLLAAVSRGRRWFAEHGRRERERLPIAEGALPEIYEREFGDALVDEKECAMALLGRRQPWREGESLPQIFWRETLFLRDAPLGPSGDAGDGMPLVWPRNGCNPSSPRRPELFDARTEGLLAHERVRVFDWNRPSLIVALRMSQAVAPHLEGAASASRLRANQKKRPAAGPALRGKDAAPGELFFDQGRFWMVAQKPVARSKSVRCWAVSSKFAQMWLWPEAPAARPASLAGAMALGDEELLAWSVAALRSRPSPKHRALDFARQRCEALSGGSLAMIKAAQERASLLQEVERAAAEPEKSAGGAGGPKDKKAAEAARRKPKRI